MRRPQGEQEVSKPQLIPAVLRLPFQLDVGIILVPTGMTIVEL